MLSWCNYVFSAESVTKKDQVKVQIANTNFVEHFDVSGIQAVFKGAMELCLQ